MDFRADDIFLGSGGGGCGLDLLRNGHVQHLLDLPPGQSVYAIDVAPGLAGLAVGTKAGFIYWLAESGGEAPLTLPSPLFQGSPILAACFIDASRLVISDVAGRCLLWNGTTKPRQLREGEGVVCTLVRLDGGRFAGLVSSGELIIWDDRAEIVDRMTVPPPPPALVRMCYWPAARSLVWPGREGKLVFADVQRRQARQIAAHDRMFTALAVGGDELITVGPELIKCWRADGACSRQFAALGQGVLAVSILRDTPDSLLLLRVTGEVELHTRGEAALATPEGRAYRSLWAADEATWARVQRERRAEEAKALVSEIKQRSSRGADGEVDELHRRLEQLGYGHVSLCLRARSARQRQDIVAECCAYYALMQMLPESGMPIESLRRGAALAEQVWQLELSGELHTACLDPQDSGQTKKTAETLAAVRGGPHIIHSDLSLAVLIEAAAALGKPIQGRFCLERWRSRACRGVAISREVLLDECRQLQSEPRWSGLPHPIAERAQIVSVQGAEPADVVLFSSDDGFALAIKLSGKAGQTVAEFYVLFDCGGVGDEPTTKRNERCKVAVNDAALPMRRLLHVRDMVIAAMRRILSRASGADQDMLGGIS